jgi:hypothetical protein
MSKSQHDRAIQRLKAANFVEVRRTAARIRGHGSQRDLALPLWTLSRATTKIDRCRAQISPLDFGLRNSRTPQKRSVMEERRHDPVVADHRSPGFEVSPFVGESIPPNRHPIDISTSALVRSSANCRPAVPKSQIPFKRDRKWHTNLSEMPATDNTRLGFCLDRRFVAFSIGTRNVHEARNYVEFRNLCRAGDV